MEYNISPQIFVNTLIKDIDKDLVVQDYFVPELLLEFFEQEFNEIWDSYFSDMIFSTFRNNPELNLTFDWLIKHPVYSHMCKSFITIYSYQFINDPSITHISNVISRSIIVPRGNIIARLNKYQDLQRKISLLSRKLYKFLKERCNSYKSNPNKSYVS